MTDKDLYVDGTEMAVEKPRLPDVYKKRIIFWAITILLTVLIFGGIRIAEAMNTKTEPEDGPHILSAETTESTGETENAEANVESTIVTEAPEVTESPTEVVTEPVVEPETEPVTETVETENPNLVTYYDVPLSEDLQDHIFEMCKKKNVDPIVIIAMIRRESNYKASNMGDGGDSYGLMQIQPKWHKKRMDKLGCTDLLDPYQNVTVGIDLFGDLLSTGKGVEWALMAYNGGSSYANKKAANGEITKYVERVMQTVQDLEALKYYK